MNPEVVAAIGAIVLGITGGFFGMMRYMIKTLAELRPNSGSSMKDKVEINSERLKLIEVRVDDIYRILAN
tara:strand:- start:3772 stop:3981 length:210 start_codon:yes stop_codon:yes gene_type:complete